ncbi:MAG: hypothetical protein JNK82_36225 [Myxococcaceae bacterium]|nr:hypothetical protein [Myxococcaceae bacterium]
MRRLALLLVVTGCGGGGPSLSTDRAAYELSSGSVLVKVAVNVGPQGVKHDGCYLIDRLGDDGSWSPYSPLPGFVRGCHAAGPTDIPPFGSAAIREELREPGTYRYRTTVSTGAGANEQLISNTFEVR